MNNKELMLETIKTLNKVQLRIVDQIEIDIQMNANQLWPLIIEKANADLKDKLPAKVTLKNIDINDTNQVTVLGAGVAMGIEKDFTMKATLNFDEDAQTIAVKVDDITVDGNFLIQQGFNAMMPAIIEKIESKTNFDINTLITNLKINQNIPAIQRSLLGAIDKLEVQDVSIVQNEDLLDIKLAGKSIEATIVLNN